MMSDKDDHVLKALDVSQEVIAQSAHPSASYAFKCIEKAIAIQKAQARVIEEARNGLLNIHPWSKEYDLLKEVLAALDEVKKE